MHNENQSPYMRFRHVSTLLFKIDFAFLVLYTIAYFIVVELVGLVKGILDPWAGFFDIFIGVGIAAVFILAYGIAHTRIGALLTVLGFIYWWFIPGKDILRNSGIIPHGFLYVWITNGLAWLAIGLLAILGLFVFLAETINLLIHKRSWLAGPWFNAMWAGGRPWIFPRLDSKQRRAIAKTLVATGICCGLFIAGGMSLLDGYSPSVVIHPQHYNITYNFWATPGIYDNNSDEALKYGLGPLCYSNASLDQFNKHHVNLDLTFSDITNASLATLVKWETRCPNITYRITMAPQRNLRSFAQQVMNATNLLMAWENSSKIHQWKGFCFDIEGNPFEYLNATMTFDESTAAWNQLFDFIDQKSIARHKTIDMECVSDMWPCQDVPFDGDADLQAEHGLSEYFPERFTVYAPMIYRCWYKGTIPYGSPMDPAHPWDTSYTVYSQLRTLTGSVPAGKAGFYIGITNTSCYGRNLPQPEPYTWPSGTNTGFYNLMRDILIAKHFGIKELTFFLAWTAFENHYSMGGVFESYGNDFLDRVNETVNTNPPAEFTIFYKQADAAASDHLRFDWQLDTNRILGMTEMALLWIASIIIVMVIPAYMKSKARKEKPSRNQENPMH